MQNNHYKHSIKRVCEHYLAYSIAYKLQEEKVVAYHFK